MHGRVHRGCGRRTIARRNSKKMDNSQSMYENLPEILSQYGQFLPENSQHNLDIFILQWAYPKPCIFNKPNCSILSASAGEVRSTPHNSLYLWRRGGSTFRNIPGYVICSTHSWRVAAPHIGAISWELFTCVVQIIPFRHCAPRGMSCGRGGSHMAM